MGEGTTRLVNSFIVYKDTRSIFTSRDSGVTPCKGTQCDAWRVVGGVADPYTLDVLAIKGNSSTHERTDPLRCITQTRTRRTCWRSWAMLNSMTH